MKKTTIILITVVLVLVVGYILFINNKSSDLPKNEETPSETVNEETTQTTDREVSGTVVSVNTDQVPADGPALVTIRTEEGSDVTVAIRSMGINLCPAQANILDVYTLQNGEKVEARGEVGLSGMILPCESSAHFLRVAAQ